MALFGDADFTETWCGTRESRRPSSPTSYPFTGDYVGAHLAVAPDGRLWLTGVGSGLVRFDRTNMTRLTPKDGLLSMDTGGLSVAPDGAVWFGDGPRRSHTL